MLSDIETGRSSANLSQERKMATNNTRALNILEVSASGRRIDSISRKLTAELIDVLEARFDSVSVKKRDLAEGMPLVDERWIAANFTADEERNTEQRKTLAASDALVAEIKAADILIIGSPIYNFGVPASLKAWIDMVARARLTFQYTANGPEGLMKNKKAYVVMTSGGVAVDSAVDFATPQLRQALQFIGITDIEVIAADQLNMAAEDSIDAARVRIADLIHTTSSNKAAVKFSNIGRQS
jgi:FMN-dependent NADH-azoreductase